MFSFSGRCHFFPFWSSLCSAFRISQVNVVLVHTATGSTPVLGSRGLSSCWCQVPLDMARLFDNPTEPRRRQLV
ncbi:hypothetical protein BDA99DRAFT_508335 [Phascolomyces articulosus]|uniref:Secreted protein n=1 Tax=Phascolomyces articulosus TaxID=60185 RepID=A0AAD5KAT0_9FUNG|nr:hypothetical protein BDA99DRAFT_508335 [Phascolomyces articulosus]